MVTLSYQQKQILKTLNHKPTHAKDLKYLYCRNNLYRSLSKLMTLELITKDKKGLYNITNKGVEILCQI